MNKSCFLLAIIVCLVFTNISLHANTLEEQLTALQAQQNVEDVKQATLQLLIEQLDSYNIPWEKDDKIGLQAFVNTENAGGEIVFATSILDSPKQLAVLIQLLQLSRLHPPANNLQIVFFLHEKIEQPQRTQFSLPPYDQLKISAFSSSHTLLSHGDSFAAVFYLVGLEDPALIITATTPLSMLKQTYSELNFLPIRGGMREFSRTRDFPELENVYNRYNTPLILLSMAATDDPAEHLYKLSQQTLEKQSDGFFYALAFHNQLYIVQDIFIYFILIILQLCWVLVDLTRFHGPINWRTLISFLLLLVASVSLAFVFEKWLLRTIPQTLSRRALGYLIALLSSQIILFLPLRLPRTQLSLRLLEASLAALFVYSCLQRPLTALLLILPLILLTFCQHLLQVSLRRFLISTTLFFIFLLFLFLAIIEALQDSSSYFGLLLILPILALVSLQHNLHGIRRNAQIWLNITIFSLAIFTISFSLRSNPKLLINNAFINYRFQFLNNTQSTARVYFQTDAEDLISLSENRLQYSGQETQISLERPTSELTRLENKRRNFYKLHIAYQHPLKVLLIQLPAQTILRDQHIRSLAAHVFVFYEPTLPLDLELVSRQNQALEINFAATLTEEPFAPTLATSETLLVKKNTELYWTISSEPTEE